MSGLSSLPASIACSQEYPAKPVRIVTADVGSLTDLSARLIAQGLTANLGQQFIVENRGGASGTIAAQTVAKAPPDGYTLLIYSGALWLGPLMQDLPWNALRDFSPIAAAVKSPNVLAVHPSLPVKSVRELIALARARPGELNYGSSSVGAGNHLAAELFKSLANVNIVRVAYKGGGAMMNALISGEVQVVFGAAGLVKPHAASGRLRALGICNTEPSALMPGLPTVAASGLPGYRSETLIAVFAPARTPEAIVGRMNQEVVRVLDNAAMKERFVNGGVDIVASSPERLIATIKSDIVSIGKLVQDAGLRLNVR